MVLCTQPSRAAINRHERVKIPPPGARAAAPAGDGAADETGLPAADTVRSDSAPVVDAIERFHPNRAAVAR